MNTPLRRRRKFLRGDAEGDGMMSTVISSKKVMDVLLEEYNENSV